MDFDWTTLRETAEKWGVLIRRVHALCANGQVAGVLRLKDVWLIPKDASKPQEGWAKNGRKSVLRKKEYGHE